MSMGSPAAGKRKPEGSGMLTPECSYHSATTRGMCARQSVRLRESLCSIVAIHANTARHASLSPYTALLAVRHLFLGHMGKPNGSGLEVCACPYTRDCRINTGQMVKSLGESDLKKRLGFVPFPRYFSLFNVNIVIFCFCLFYYFVMTF